MSFWTHVNGSIRFDIFSDEDVITEKDLGIICTFEDWKETDMPCGSEGGLQYKIIETGYGGSIAKQMVAFWGDLRDYENDNEIIAYFNRIVEGRDVRSGIIKVDGQKEFMLVCGKNKFEVIAIPDEFNLMK